MQNTKELVVHNRQACIDVDKGTTYSISVGGWVGVDVGGCIGKCGWVGMVCMLLESMHTSVHALLVFLSFSPQDFSLVSLFYFPVCSTSTHLTT